MILGKLALIALNVLEPVELKPLTIQPEGMVIWALKAHRKVGLVIG